MILLLGDLSIKLQKLVPCVLCFCAPWVSKTFWHVVPASEKHCSVQASESPLAVLSQAPGSIQHWALAVWVHMPDLKRRVGVQKHHKSGHLILANSRCLHLQLGESAPSLASSLGTELWTDAHTWKLGGLALDSSLLCMKPFATAFSGLWSIFWFVFFCKDENSWALAHAWGS